MSKLRRAEQNLARILSSSGSTQIEVEESRRDLDRTRAEIEQLAAAIRKVEAQP